MNSKKAVTIPGPTLSIPACLQFSKLHPSVDETKIITPPLGVAMSLARLSSRVLFRVMHNTILRESHLIQRVYSISVDLTFNFFPRNVGLTLLLLFSYQDLLPIFFSDSDWVQFKFWFFEAAFELVLNFLICKNQKIFSVQFTS